MSNVIDIRTGKPITPRISAREKLEAYISEHYGVGEALALKVRQLAALRGAMKNPSETQMNQVRSVMARLVFQVQVLSRCETPAAKAEWQAFKQTFRLGDAKQTMMAEKA